jgi:putative transposase
MRKASGAPRAKRSSKAASAGNLSKTGARSTDNAQTATAAAEPTSRAPELTDEFEDLIKLEEENKNLRKALSEKLRAENADLRKRLGQR